MLEIDLLLNPEALAQTNIPPPKQTGVDESERLWTVRSYQVLGPPVESMLDSLARLAASHFEAPVAFISLMDEHFQFFEATVGLPSALVPRDTSFCTHTIQIDNPLVVLDAGKDLRFSSNPWVVGFPRVRFYAGAPLIDGEGITLGTFCVLDVQPRRKFTQAQQTALQDFAQLAIGALEQRRELSHNSRSQRELLKSNERYQLAAKAGGKYIWDWDEATDALRLPAHAFALVGLEPPCSTIPMAEWLSNVHPADIAQMALTLQDLKSTQLPTFNIEYRKQHADGTWRWITTTGIAIRNGNGELIRSVGTLSDITAQKLIEPQTGLHTTASLIDVLDRRLKSPPTPGRTFALLFIDFEAFKRISSNVGYVVREQLLLECARRITETISKKSGDIAVRMSGGEFAVFLSSIAAEEDAIMYAYLLHELLQLPFHVNDQQVSLSACIGVAAHNASCESPNELLQRAEFARHQGEPCEHGRTGVFSDSMQKEVQRRMLLTSDLREAILNESLELYYQPKLDLASQQLVGFEALARWRHPVFGFIPPTEFIPLAEESGLIFELGRWILRAAIGQLADWRTSGLVAPNITMAVNLSARQFADRLLLTNVVNKLGRHKDPASCLSLEVTEGILIDTEGALEILQKLKRLGVGLDLDDFGTGYSSLSYLQRFPFDSLKIDRSFVQDMESKPDRAILVRSIIALSHALKLKVVAEGIESPEQVTMLREMGCEYGQGFLFSKPLPPGEIAAFMDLNGSSFATTFQLPIFMAILSARASQPS